MNQVTQRLSTHPHRDMRAVKCIFCHIKGTLFHGLIFHRDSSPHLIAYLDINWDVDVSIRRSITGGYIFLGRKLVCWTTKKQVIMSRSSAESEYQALIHMSLTFHYTHLYLYFVTI